MEVDQIQCKFPIISNGYRKLASTKVGQSRKMNDQYPDDEEEGENKRGTANDGGAADLGGGVGRFYGWPSSRIVRVSRASGGKDRHSKVLTSKGPRDRRVRLSVNTAIQFYDLQDRLGYDQPSKAVEWLLTAAASSIAELPPMNSPFPNTPKKLSNDQKRLSTRGSDQLGLDSAEVAMDLQQEQVTKSSICSSNSETSKGSGLSISRSESRIQARERAKERFAEKEKERESESSYVASFTELLSGGINSINGGCNSNSISPNGSVHQNPNRGSGENSTDESTFFQKSPRQWSSSPMDYFTSGLLVPPAATRPGQIVASPPFTVAADHHPELQPFSFVPDNLVSASASSSGLAAFNRRTLQSNSSSSSSLSSLLPHVQRFPHTDGSSTNFFIGATAAPIENRHHFLPGFDARLQLYYGDAHGNNGRYAGQKGKEKNR